MEWTGAKYADAPTVQVDRRVRAEPQRLWELVSDIELMAEVSEELQHVEWLDPEPGLGARFRGTNRNAALGQWQTVSTVVGYEPGREFAWAVGSPQPGTPSATWRFTIEPDGDGAILTQWAQIGPGPSGLTLAIEEMPDKEEKIVFVRLKYFERSMTRNLDEIARRAESP